MDGEDLQAALERWDAARAVLAAFPFQTLTTQEKLAMVEHVEHAQRHDLALSHTVTAAFLDDADPKVFGERSIGKVIATRLRITDADAGHRISDARDLGPRWTLTGEPLSPRLSETAAALARGDIGARHVAEIQKALKKLPPWVGATAHAEAEQTLAHLAVGLDPENLRRAAEHLIALLDPDGDEPNDELQQRQRHFTIGKQQRDGMTPIKGMLDDRRPARRRHPQTRPTRTEPAQRYGRNARHPQRGATPPRRAENRAARPRRLRHPRPDQRLPRHHRRHRDGERPRKDLGLGRHRRRHPPPRTRPHRDGRAIPALPRRLRRPPPGSPLPRPRQNAAPPPPNASRCSRATRAAPARAAPNRHSSAQPTTHKTSPTAGSPMSTPSPWPANRTT